MRVLVVGNPANTNCLIAMNNAPDIPNERFTAMTRLDHNRAKAQLAVKAGVHVNDVTNMTIWGNHSATQYPDLFHAKIDGRSAAEVIDDQAWLEGDFIPTVQKRGAAIIEARGPRRAPPRPPTPPSTTCRTWVDGTPEGDWVSMAIPSDGCYGVPEGLISLVPRAPRKDGEYEIVQGLELDDVLPGAHRRLRGRAGRGARRGRRARPHLIVDPAARSGDVGHAQASVGRQNVEIDRGGAGRGYLRNLLVVLSASTLPPVWHVAQ